MKKWWQVIVFIAIIVIVDQLSKWGIRTNFMVGESIPVIDGLFNLTYVRNTGVAFGFGAGKGELFRSVMVLGLPSVICIWMVFFIKSSLQQSKLLTVAYSMILAGAIGNLIDRFLLKYVVDMFDFYFKDAHFHVFNVADSAITVAAGLLIIDMILQSKKKEEKKEA